MASERLPEKNPGPRPGALYFVWPSRPYTLRMNIELKHMLYKCETCRATFGDRAAWEKHMDDQVHQPEYTDHWAPRFDCQTSSREFSQSTANQHMAAIGYWADVS
ncbi:hypothetical protein BDV39DRAFT_197686 [Aspergillus sergii]|uniref:C2H2-type domain-containing protein n=1 Tax=Aspergillus sergii TaxID=1034303 RepID=A0A5N6WLA5_9EURO|nr:hypothetical protein BDV39DRAFT_197686 [Aspergillus sergii]